MLNRTEQSAKPCVGLPRLVSMLGTMHLTYGPRPLSPAGAFLVLRTRERLRIMTRSARGWHGYSLIMEKVALIADSFAIAAVFAVLLYVKPTH